VTQETGNKRRLQTSDLKTDVENIREEIRTLIRSNRPLAPKFVRLGFHDCVGGCDGCVDMQTEPDNNGLDIPIQALTSIVAKWKNDLISRADIWALSAMVGAEMTQNREEFRMDYVGRIDCEDTGNVCRNANGNVRPCRFDLGDAREMPGSNLLTHELLDFFSHNFGFTPQEVVALMGAHSIGTASRQNSGFDGPAGWDDTNDVLDVDYYRKLIGPGNSLNDLIDAPNWNQETIRNTGDIPDRVQWRRRKTNNVDIIGLNVDIALCRDMSGRTQASGSVSCRFKNNNRCPHAAATIFLAATYRNNQNLFLRDFESVFKKTIINGYEESDLTEVPLSSPSLSPSSSSTDEPTSSSTDEPTGFPSPFPSIKPSISSVPSISSQPSTIPSESHMPSSQCQDNILQHFFFPWSNGTPGTCITLFRSATQEQIRNRCKFVDLHSLPIKDYCSQTCGMCTSAPSLTRSVSPSDNPTTFPSHRPSKLPSTLPSFIPTIIPSTAPSSLPTIIPSTTPSSLPTTTPSTSPSFLPTITPSISPSGNPSKLPSPKPPTSPISFPTSNPSAVPSLSPTTQFKTSKPSLQCQDNSSTRFVFTWGNKGSCKKLFKNASTIKKIRNRCKIVDENGLIVKDHCTQTCGMCTNAPSLQPSIVCADTKKKFKFRWNQNSKCKNLFKGATQAQINTRCKFVDDGGLAVMKYCSKTCDSCTGCQDKSKKFKFSWNDSENSSCKKLFKTAENIDQINTRCNFMDERGFLVKDYCQFTCDTC